MLYEVITDDVVGGVLQEGFEIDLRLGDDAHRAGSERFHRDLGALFRERGADDDGRWVLGHDLLEERQTVHARHFNVQHDYVGPLVLQFFEREDRVLCRGDDFDGS